MRTLYINHLNELPEAAGIFLNENKNHRIFAFFGDLGSGKTTFIKAICNELNVIDIVSSPTFSLINEYQTDKGNTIYHMDFYRINSVNEAYDIGIEEYFKTDNYCFIEWPERIESILPNDTIFVKITEKEENARIINIY
jgi:tRNA threonylcarbamoyladenosine biosynthesis protein TsaE